jgi:ABC-type lipoprotein export system ATPase subunit
MALFAELNREGQTILMVTHNSDNARASSRVINMRDGRISWTPEIRASSMVAGSPGRSLTGFSN